MPTELIHDGGVDGVGAARDPVLAARVEDDVALSGHHHRHRVRVVLVQVLVAMATLDRRPRYRVVAREVDADDVASADGDAVARIQSEVAVSDPQRHDDRLADHAVPVASVTRPQRRPKRRTPIPIRDTAAPSPIFGPCLLWLNDWMDQHATWYGGRPHCSAGDIVLDDTYR